MICTDILVRFEANLGTLEAKRLHYSTEVCCILLANSCLQKCLYLTYKLLVRHAVSSYIYIYGRV